MSYYVFFHFKSDIVPHINTLPPSPPPAPAPIWLLVFVSFSTLNLLLSTHIFLPSSPYLSCSILHGTLPFPFPLFHLCHHHDIFHMYNALFSLSISSLFFPLFLAFSAQTTPRLCQSLCVRGHCFGFRRPARCRRRSTRQGRGVRIRCSLGTGCTSCPGPPIAQTCCMSMPPGKTSNRAKLPLTTSEGASHCPG